LGDELVGHGDGLVAGFGVDLREGAGEGAAQRADRVEVAERGAAYLEHYNTGRPHRGIGLEVPIPTGALSAVDTSTDPDAPIERVDVLGGLIHEYQRAA
jgi:tagatose-1,6-bisphosphate aldolase non-catalytic subunit AgaZ/GatZ